MVWQKSYCESGNLQFETPFTSEKRRYAKKYYLSGDISAEIQYTNDKTNGAVKVYYKEKSLSRKQMHKIESLLVENALATKLLRVCILRD